jgi:hypothetical protein
MIASLGASILDQAPSAQHVEDVADVTAGEAPEQERAGAVLREERSIAITLPFPMGRHRAATKVISSGQALAAKRAGNVSGVSHWSSPQSGRTHATSDSCQNGISSLWKPGPSNAAAVAFDN